MDDHQIEAHQREMQERLSQAEATIERLIAQVDSLTAAPREAVSRRSADTDTRADTALHADTDHQPDSRASLQDDSTDRRHLFKRAGIAVGAAAAAGLAATALDASPAAAWDNDPLLVGNVSNQASSPTRAANVFTDDAHLFEFSDRLTGAPSNSGRASLSGYAQDLDFAVLGHNTRNGGIGVRAKATGVDAVALSANSDGTNSIGVAATGVRSAIQTLMPAGFDNTGVTVLGGLRGVEISSCTFPLSIPRHGYPGPPTFSVLARIGDFYVDSIGDLYQCVADGNPGTWRRVCGPSTAGAFTAVNPTRVYDSRLSAGRLSGGQDRVTSVANGIDPTTGTVTVPNLVPQGATAIQYNLSIAETVASGFLQVAPGDVSGVTSASINWYSSNQILGNGLTVKLDANRQIRTTARGGSTHYIIDILGYYL